MKKILITLLFFAFYCNSSFARTSFDEKLAKLDELISQDRYTPKQMQILIQMGSEGYTNCFQSSTGAICKFSDQFCLIKNNNGLSLKCLKESDLDELISAI